MAISLAAAFALAAQCAPAVAPETLLSVVQVESGFDPLAIGVNGKPRISVSAATRTEAVSKASALIAAGRSVDLGLAQINSRNLAWLGLTIEDAFDPCRNLAAAARVLRGGYDADQASIVGEQRALRVALSRYNTGDAARGFDNGYVTKVVSASARIVPAIQSPPGTPTEAAEPPPLRPAWDVFGQTDGAAGFIIRVSTPAPTFNGDPK
jgi:type IV secretion system protein VirB1